MTISPEKFDIDGLEINRVTVVGYLDMRSAGHGEAACVKANEPIPPGAPSLGTKF
jgi:hypothetical protein